MLDLNALEHDDREIIKNYLAALPENVLSPLQAERSKKDPSASDALDPKANSKPSTTEDGQP